MSVTAAPQPRWNERKIHFDPTRPRWIQVVKLAAQMAAIFGSLGLSLLSMFLYPMLLTGQGFALVYLGVPLLVFGLTFSFIRSTWFPADMPQVARLQFRLGVGMLAGFGGAGLFGIVNGYHTPVVVQDFPMAYRRTSTPSDARHMSYYVGTRVWPFSQDVYEITVPRSLYVRLDDVPVVVSQWRITRQQLHAMPAHGALRLMVGRGRLGVNWLNGVIGTAPISDEARQEPDTRRPEPRGAP